MPGSRRTSPNGRKRVGAVVLTFATVFGLGQAMANHVAAGAPLKVFVCKFVGTPGVDERLQTGNNPISVSVNAIPAEAMVGSFFADAQGRSFVLAFDEGQDEPDVSECPAPDVPPTTTMMATTTEPGATTTEPGATTTSPGATTTSTGDYPPQVTTPTTVVAGPGPGGGGLPATGSNSDGTLQIAIAALLVGAGLLAAAGGRRRATKP